MSFDKVVAKWVKKAKDETNKQFRANVLALHRDIVRGTPVDTGALQNNWQFGVNNLNNRTLGIGAGKGITTTRAAKNATSLTVLDTAIIFNNMPYAEVIENGIDGTARVPARMVAKALVQARSRNKK